MIEWLRAKTNPVPVHYDCLLLLDSGEVRLGRAQTGMAVIGWSTLNRPVWLTPKAAKPGHVHGERHPKVFLSDADCELIRELYGEGGTVSYAQLGQKFDCSKSTIRDIVKCRTRYRDNP
ncbi:hypothetical protein KEF85_05785 [Methylomonas paludis]|uniref:Uncharacterized protein n=1 Tax=Methylomonas paludis TaxID=1173101 RepID=A0A975MQB4_9GAMM|nr:hypothetical protein [Methylomonas paludis]QWF71965.1 hypothetical protein KEF85_05785 [Methylomonas paludis]